MGFLGLGMELDLISSVELIAFIGVVLYAIYVGSSIGIFRKSR